MVFDPNFNADFLDISLQGWYLIQDGDHITFSHSIPPSLINMYIHCNHMDMLGLGLNVSLLYQNHLLGLFLYTQICLQKLVVTLWKWVTHAVENIYDVTKYVTSLNPDLGNCQFVDQSTSLIYNHRQKCPMHYFVLFHLGRHKNWNAIPKIMILW